jgi:hypothetical protein
MCRGLLSLLCLVLFLPVSTRAADAVDYLKEIKPILAAKCYACHGALQQKSGLRVDTVKFLLEGGDKGPVVVAGQPQKSSILDHVTGANKARRMPPPMDGEPLDPQQVARLKDWIDQGAKGPADEKPEADPRDHWAFRPPVRPSLPPGAKAANAIDAFIAADLEKKGLLPQRPADKRLLLRRVYLDLIGLPPTLEEQEAFLKDTSLDAYEKVVDRLLASKHHGERWGRHWMDIWRYSDWWGLGQEVRNSQKHIWHWRDWIIESLNADKGYDEMVREMLAADELFPNDLGRLRATGYLVRPYFIFNRSTWLDETIEHTSKGFLGLTFNCVKCHDHKYDPFVHGDYYRLRAFFEPYQVRTDQVPGETDYEKDGIPRVFDANLEAPTFLHIRGDDRNPNKDKVYPPGLPKVLIWEKLDIQPVKLPTEAYKPGTRSFVIDNHLAMARKQVEVAQAGVELARKALAAGEKPAANALSPPEAKAALVIAERTLLAAQAELESVSARVAADQAEKSGDKALELARHAAKVEKHAAVARAEAAVARAELAVLQSKPDKKSDMTKKLAVVQTALAAARKAMEVAGDKYTPLRGARKAPESSVVKDDPSTYPNVSSGRRSALAQWITDRRNPLTARVAVNHLWGRHFGRPLVGNVFDFGRKGTPPSHPGLLDWLAVELMEKGWSLKHMHRLMVTSSLYRSSSSNADSESNLARDPENVSFWRMNPLRMEAQVVRDSLLYLAGELDLRIGGPSIPVAQDSKRRSLYFVHSHNDQHKFLSVFDDANVRECYRRSESIVPQQALALSNSQLALSTALKVHERLQARFAKASDADFVRASFALVLGCEPTSEEQGECEAALREFVRLAPRQADAQRRARTNLLHALLNHNDFITVR